MYLHPIIVHFPIALLSVYCILELISIERLQKHSYWFYIKGFLVLVGWLFALLAFLTGPDHHGNGLIEMHHRFAITTLIVFAIIGLFYKAEWYRRMNINWPGAKYLRKVRMPNRATLCLLALIGLGAITITGGLGGAIVYGTDFDPFMSPIFKLLGVI